MSITNVDMASQAASSTGKARSDESGAKVREVEPPIDAKGLRRRRVRGTEKVTALEQRQDGQFPGSFAGTARKETEIHIVPWYLRREYFLVGWTDACIWRAAVRLAYAPFPPGRGQRPPSNLTQFLKAL